jgi:hypothetical protein
MACPKESFLQYLSLFHFLTEGNRHRLPIQWNLITVPVLSEGHFLSFVGLLLFSTYLAECSKYRAAFPTAAAAVAVAAADRTQRLT